MTRNSDPPAVSSATPLSAAAPSRPGPLAGLAVLKLLRPLGALALLAAIVGRMIAPAVAGLMVGVGRLVRAVEIAGAALSQLFAIGAVVTAMALIGEVARSRAPYALRLGAILAGSFVLLVVLNATVERVPDLPAALIGVFAAALALGAAVDALRAPHARPVAVALGLVGVGALVRLAGLGLAVRSADGTLPRLAAAARGVVTAAFVIDALAVLVATATLAVRRRAPEAPPEPAGAPAGPPPDPRPPALASPWTLVALALALLATRQALAAGADEPAAFDILLRRALDRLLTRPAPLVPLGVQLFVGALSVLAALVALIAPARFPPLSGALALLLVARTAPEVPLGGAALVIAAFGVALAARDERGFWAAILAARPAPGAPGATSGAHPAPAAPAPAPSEEVRQVDAEGDNH